MEAVGLYNFVAKEVDELSFNKGAQLRILNVEDDPNWFTAECGLKSGLVPSNYIEMKPNPWYVPECSRGDAEDKLLANDDNNHYIYAEGTYLVRKSINNRGSFSLSVKNVDEVIHFRILCNEDYQVSIWNETFPSVNKLIDYYMTHSVCKDGQPQLFLKSTLTNSSSNPVCSGFYVAQFDFNGLTSDELSFKHGDVIKKLGEEDSNWWIGEHNGRRGIFPCNHVHKLKDGPK